MHSKESYKTTANKLIEHIRTQLKETSGRPEWTEQNLRALQTFSIEGAKMSWFPQTDDSKRSGLKGQFLWDHMGFADDDVVVIAESEWNGEPGGLKHDFEKLLYTRCPIKLMMCGRWARDGSEIAEDLADYAKKCSTNFGPGEVFILYCVGWMNPDENKRNDQVFLWQVPGEVAWNDGTSFKFRSLQA